jgi:hypothetical protein
MLSRKPIIRSVSLSPLTLYVGININLSVDSDIPKDRKCSGSPRIIEYKRRATICSRRDRI